MIDVLKGNIRIQSAAGILQLLGQCLQLRCASNHAIGLHLNRSFVMDALAEPAEVTHSEIGDALAMQKSGDLPACSKVVIETTAS